MLKWIIISPLLLFYLLRDMAMLLKHQDLLRGISILILISLLGIFFTAWLIAEKENYKIKKRLENNSYDWSEFE